MKKYYHSLNLLKYILSILIVFHHFQQDAGGGVTFSEGLNFFGDVISFGYLVEFFFIISGFLEANKLNEIDKYSFKEYITHKLLRLYPTVLIAFIFNLFILFVRGYLFKDLSINVFPSVYKMFASATLVFSGGSIRDISIGINNPTWYLCVLLICYLITYFINYISKNNVHINKNYLYVFMIFLGIGIIEYDIELPFLNYAVARGYMAYFLGIILNKLFKKYQRILCIASCFIFIGCTLMYVYNFKLFCENQQLEFTFVMFPSILFIFLSLENVLNNKLFDLLGNASFSIYIWHDFWISVVSIVTQLLDINNFSRLDMYKFALFMTLFSIAYHKFIEIRINGIFKY